MHGVRRRCPDDSTRSHALPKKLGTMWRAVPGSVAAHHAEGFVLQIGLTPVKLRDISCE